MAGPAAAQTPAICADPQAFCTQRLDAKCFRLGAGAEEACDAQWAAYRDCLAEVPRRCPTRGAGGGGAAARCTDAQAREYFALAERRNSCASFRAFIEACPASRRAAFARAALVDLGCAAPNRPAATPSPAASAPREPSPPPVRKPAPTPALEQPVEGGARGRPAPPPPPVDREAAARAAWAALRGSLDAGALRRFAAAHRGTAAAADARAALDALSAAHRAGQTELARLGYYSAGVDGAWGPGSRRALAAWQRDAGRPGANGRLTSAELAALRAAQPAPRRQPPAQASASPAQPTRQAAAVVPGRTFQDCPACPLMASLPGGSFLMGSPPDEPERSRSEGPQHRVQVRPFAIGVYEVTFLQWSACVGAGYCPLVDDRWWSGGFQHPVEMSWNDAQRFIAWLNSQVEGAPYRLPSEAEWEYAARAGSTGPYWWGSTISPDQASYRDKAPDKVGAARGDRRRASPVGSFPKNPFGLYDMHGNVSQWVADCWNDGYRGAPNDGSAWMSGDCSEAVIRGGWWGDAAKRLRSASRTRQSRNFSGVGFRVARTLTR